MSEASDERKLHTAHSLRRNGKLDEAAQLYRQLIRRDSGNFHALHYLGVTEAGAGNFERAKFLMSRSLSIQPPNIQFIENYATILFQAGEFDAAVDSCRRGLQLNNNSTALIYVSAISLFRLDQFQDALAQFDKLLLLQPKHVAGLNERGTVLAAMKQYDAALASVDRALALDPQFADAYSNKAIICGRLKRHAEALAACDRALALRPNLANAWLGRGDVLHALKRFDESIAAYDKALALEPGLVLAWLGRGNLCGELGRDEQALTAYDKALALKPNLAEAWLGRGHVFAAGGRHREAFTAYDQALAQKPDLADAWLGRGNLFCELKRYDEALAAYDRALASNPDLAQAWLGRGIVFGELRRFGEALAAHDRALALRPDLAEAWLGRGNVFCEFRHHDESLTAYQNASALKSDFVDASNGHGNAFGEFRYHGEALAAYDAALALKPGLAGAWLGRGNVLCEFGRYDEALAAYDSALALQPGLAKAWFGRGKTFSKLGRHDEALAAHDQALTQDPGLAEAWLGRAMALLETNRPTQALADIDKALAVKPDFRQAISYRIFALDFADDAGMEEQQRARRQWWREVGAKIAQRPPMHAFNDRNPDRRIRVGYVSADFRMHSAAMSFRPMLLNHDKTQFEITCYSACTREDDYTDGFRRAADRWRDVAQLSGDEFCAQIEADRIDILVDLSGHTGGHRLGVFARKPAPLQVSAGATGTGLPTIDYLFSDPVICPPAVRHLFAETIVDLPSIMTIEPLPDRLRPADPPVLSKGCVTFGVFNRATKISDDILTLWARILHAVPRSKMLMKHYGFEELAMRNRLSKKFAMHGIAADRIIFLGATSRRDHLAAFDAVDISLDPFPHNGGISTLESLQMGVPVVARLGKTISSRVAGAILTSVGMSDWVADGADGYAAIAVKFASLHEHLKTLRHALPTTLAASAAGNSAIYTKAVETAYREMWVEYCRSESEKSQAV